MNELKNRCVTALDNSRINFARNGGKGLAELPLKHDGYSETEVEFLSGNRQVLYTAYTMSEGDRYALNYINTELERHREELEKQRKELERQKYSRSTKITRNFSDKFVKAEPRNVQSGHRPLAAWTTPDIPRERRIKITQKSTSKIPKKHRLGLLDFTLIAVQITFALMAVTAWR